LLSGPQPAGDGLSSGNARHRGYHGFLLWRRVVLLVPDSPRAGGQVRNILLSLVSFPDDEEATFAKTGSGRMQDESFEMRQDRFVHSHFYKTLPIVLWDSKAACLLLKTAVRKTRSFCAIDIFQKRALFGASLFHFKIDYFYQDRLRIIIGNAEKGGGGGGPQALALAAYDSDEARIVDWCDKKRLFWSHFML
jgi:hypothetical protein